MKEARGAITVEWSDPQRIFVVQAAEKMADQFPALELAPVQPNRLPSEGFHIAAAQDLAAQMNAFQYCTTMEDVKTLRSQILVAILPTPTPLRWLPRFLLLWQALLTSMGERDSLQVVSADTVNYCHELVALARGWKLVGDIVQARETLGKCFQVIRRHLKAPFAAPLETESAESQALRIVAVVGKTFLLSSVAFQHSLARCKELWTRRDAPPQVLSSLSKEFWLLFRQAPFSLEIAILLANSLMKHGRCALVTRFLQQSVFTMRSAELTLMHARALAYVGFYRLSLQIAQTFLLQEIQAKDEAQYINTLKAHASHLAELLACREKADNFLQKEEFAKALDVYDECMALVDPDDHNFTAAMLFGRANALLGLEKLQAAVKELQKSLQLDPSNKLAALRLKTAHLQLETELIQKELRR